MMSSSLLATSSNEILRASGSLKCASGRGAADEITLVEFDEAAPIGFRRIVIGGEVAAPGAITFFHAHGMERADAEHLQAMSGTGSTQALIDMDEVVRCHIDFVTKFAGEARPDDQRIGKADMDLPRLQEGEGGMAEIGFGQLLQHSARLWTGQRQAGIVRSSRS